MESMFAPTLLSPRARRSLLRRQHAVHADSDFNRLLDSVLGSPFLTTHDLPDLDVVDGSFQAVSPSLAVTRPSSPDVVNQHSARPRGFISRFWDALRRSRHKSSKYIDDGEPLDGEEGELIDDEACFIDVDSFTTAVDIVSRLPPELSIHLLSFLDLDSIIACRAVSKTWRIYARDNAIWKGLFERKSEWRLDLSRARFSAATTRRVSYISSLSPELAPLSLDWWLLYKSRTQLENRWLRGKAKMTKISGHSDSVYCLEFDSKRIITGSRDRTIKVWSLKTGKQLASFKRHAGSVLCLKFDKDWDVDDPFAPGFMVTGSSDCSIIVWCLYANGRRAEVSAILGAHTGGVLDLRIDDKHIVSCSKDTLIRVWDRGTLELLATFEGHQGPVNAVGLQGNKVVSASGDGKIMMWDITTGEHLKTFEGHDRGLACIEFKDDLIVSGSNDCKIKVWSASRGECIRTLPGHDLLVRALSFDSVTGRLVSASYDRTVKVWDLHTGKLIADFKNGHVSHIFDVKLDVRRIVSTSHDQKIVVLDFSEGLDTAMFI